MKANKFWNVMVMSTIIDMKKFVIFILLCGMSIASFPQSAGYVGQRIHLTGTYSGYSGNAAWYCADGKDNCLRFSNGEVVLEDLPQQIKEQIQRLME